MFVKFFKRWSQFWFIGPTLLHDGVDWGGALLRLVQAAPTLNVRNNLNDRKKTLTHWGRVTHICVGNLTIIGSDNGLSPCRRQAIIWTNAGILLIGPLGTNFSENLIEILTFSFTKMRLKVLSAKWRPFCLGLNVLKCYWQPIWLQPSSTPMITNDDIMAEGGIHATVNNKPTVVQIMAYKHP